MRTNVQQNRNQRAWRWRNKQDKMIFQLRKKDYDVNISSKQDIQQE